MPELSPAAGDMAGDGTQATSQQPTLAEIAAASQQIATASQQMASTSQQMATASQQQQMAAHQQLAAAAQRPKGTTKEGAAKPIGMACRACRLRKIRCGGERPRCTYCVKKGYECVLTPHKKRGRPRKTEQRSQHRQQRSDAAEIQPNETEDMRGMTMPVDGLDLDVRQLWAELTGLQGLDLPPELSALAANSATQAQDTAGIPNIGPSFNLGQSLGQVDAGMLAYAANYAFPKFDTANVVTEEREAARDSPASSIHRSATDDAECPRSETPSNVQPMVDAGVQAYFTYVQPWFPILHRPTFERQINEGCVDVLLYCAVQAIAARFCDSAKKSRRPYRRGQRFARRARELLPEALKTACLSTLQAITLLALYMSVSGQWQEGAAYEKLAVQLAFIGQYHLLDEEFLLPPVTNNMGVYEAGWSEHSHPARLEVLSRPGGILDHEQRRRAWWSIFQLERFNGLAMGRPPIIKPGWHWVWLPCSEELWARENPQGPLAWEMGLADYSQRPTTSVSNCRVDLVLALIMGQLIEQRTEMFRLFFPRVDCGTLFYDNLPTHSLGWAARLRRLCDIVGSLERRIRQWHAELDRYADTFSARRHANFEIMGKSCQIHLYACVLQIREHLFEDLLINDESSRGSGGVDESAAASGDDNGSSRNSSVDLSAAFERHTGVALDKSAYQRGYVARAKRPALTLQFVHDLDVLAQRCWNRSLSMSDEIAALLRTHWLRAIENKQPSAVAADDSVTLGMSGSMLDGSVDEPISPQTESWTLGAHDTAKQPSSPAAASGSSVTTTHLDAQVADRFKLMNPQTPYHLFVAAKVQAARLKQAVTARARREKTEPRMDTSAENESPEVKDAISRINDIWDKHANDADIPAIEARLDDIISALDYAQLFWNSLNFASHLRYLKREASKPLLHSVYRE
ncbi:hypothetical protein GGH14_002274 [Coemansia sp. RSA 370]|nr:hypothetical protein GGH14_002274 [Coemansia sp. RSA 370]